MESKSSIKRLKKSILASVEIKFLIQATEDEDRFVNKVSKILKIPLEKFEKSVLEGHFGNPIMVFRVHMRGILADKFAEEILNLLIEVEKKTLISEMSNHIDKHGSLYIRINKQSIFNIGLIQSSIDPIRVRMKLRFKAPLPKMVESFKGFMAI